MWKHHWWKSSHQQCRKCGKYNAEELVKETENWFYWKCRFCGFSRKHERSWAIYKQNKNGKTLLKTNKSKKFQEVRLKKSKDYFKIVPITEVNTKRIRARFQKFVLKKENVKSGARRQFWLRILSCFQREINQRIFCLNSYPHLTALFEVIL